MCVPQAARLPGQPVALGLRWVLALTDRCRPSLPGIQYLRPCQAALPAGCPSAGALPCCYERSKAGLPPGRGTLGLVPDFGSGPGGGCKARFCRYFLQRPLDPFLNPRRRSQDPERAAPGHRPHSLPILSPGPSLRRAQGSGPGIMVWGRARRPKEQERLCPAPAAPEPQCPHLQSREVKSRGGWRPEHHPRTVTACCPPPPHICVPSTTPVQSLSPSDLMFYNRRKRYPERGRGLASRAGGAGLPAPAQASTLRDVPSQGRLHPPLPRTVSRCCASPCHPATLSPWGTLCSRSPQAQSCARGLPPALPQAPPQAYLRSQAAAGSDALGFQVCGQGQALCHCLLRSPPCWGPGSAWRLPGQGLWADLAPGSCSSLPHPPAPGLPGRWERSSTQGCPDTLRGLAVWGGGGTRGCQGPLPCSVCGMEPPAATCHVTQHVTVALLLSGAEPDRSKGRERVTGRARLGLSL